MTPIYDSVAPRAHRRFRRFVIDVIDKSYRGKNE